MAAWTHTGLCSLVVAGGCFGAAAQDTTDDAYTARDICVGVAANFANLPPAPRVYLTLGSLDLSWSRGA